MTDESGAAFAEREWKWKAQDKTIECDQLEGENTALRRRIRTLERHERRAVAAWRASERGNLDAELAWFERDIARI